MRTILLALLLAVPAVSVGAGFTASSTTTARLGSKVISAGDTAQKVQDAGGRPTQVADITNAFGTKIGERWTYMLGRGQNTIIEFNTNGTVVGLVNVTGQ